jgi:hypothetical protein
VHYIIFISDAKIHSYWASIIKLLSTYKFVTNFFRKFIYQPNQPKMITNNRQNKLSAAEQDELIKILKSRFEKNMQRHEDISWNDVAAKLIDAPAKLWSLNEMENTGGEPDVIAHDAPTNTYTFCDCSAESPKGRRSVCFDTEALESRKENKPQGDAIGIADAMSIEILTEERYRQLQSIGEFDLKTSSWIATPNAIRKLGGALFADRRYNAVFVYHNGASSYYSARGFRGFLLI